jgi:hypothetical protein
MKPAKTVTIFGIALLLIFATSQGVLADSSVNVGPSSSTTVDLNFSITIPAFVYFRVGSAAGVDTIDFSPTGAEVSAGAVVTGTGGDVSDSTVTVALLGNGGQITLTEATSGPDLLSGGDAIPFTTITTTSVGSTITPPQLNSGASESQTVVGSITNLSDTWQYAFDIPTPPPVPGTYTGSVTYTAALP